MPQEHVENDNSNPPDFADVELADIIDVIALQEMMDDFYALTGIGVGIIDLNGTVLVGTGWQDICVKFHRSVPESCKFCHESDIYLSSGVPPGTFKEYRCKNSMWDIATPIMLGDRHIGNIFLGQFLYDDEEPDYELFRAQARRFGYDEAEYLAALDRVPRWSRETVRRAMGYYSKLARMISKANYNNVVLADTLARREQAEQALQLTRTSVEAASDALFWLTPDARIVDVNESACRISGYTRAELLQMSALDLYPHFDAIKWSDQFATLRQHGSLTFESELRAKDGRLLPVEAVANYVKYGAEERNCTFVRDITERKRAEEELRESEEKFAKVFSVAPSLLVISTIAEGKYIDVNESFERFTGYRRDEAIGRTSLELNIWAAETRTRFLEAIGKEGRVRDLEAAFLSKDGEHLVGLVSAEVIEIKGEECLLVLVKDITERKRAEDKLKESERLLNKAQEIGQLGSWSLDLMTNRLVWSDEIYRIFGLQPQEFAATYEAFLDVVHPEDRDAINSAYTGSIQEGKDGYEIEHRIIRKDTGQLRYVYEKCEHVRDASGRIIRSEGMIHDITEHKQAEMALRESEERHRSIIQTAMDGFWRVDMQGRLLEVNERYCRMSGYRAEELLTMRVTDLEAAETAEMTAAHFRKFVELGEDRFESLHRRKDGSIFDVEISVQYRPVDGGQLVVFLRDITDRKQAEAELHQAKEAAEAANIAKSRFLATMSHEIRTPMNGVIGMLELLQHTGLTTEQQSYVESAKKSGFELVHLLNDILDLSKIEADRLELELSAFDLRAVIADTINLLSLSARGKAVQLVSSIDSDVATVLKGDAGRLRQLITNIVGNAIKFTPKGTVTLHIRKDQEDENSTTLRFQVSDSGIGIPADKLEHIFEPFTQVDSSTTRKFGGTGLGLAICKRLAELMGGSIGAESTEGEGSTFWFTVVFEKMTERDHGSPQPISAPRLNVEIQATESGTRLLLAEDDPIAQKLVLALLSRYGYDVDVACNGKEALLALQNNDYALVLMDCMMPEMNGYEATAAIRDPASPVRRHDIPVIAFTGNAMKEDRDRCLAAGMNDYLSKPFVLKDLLAKLDVWLKTK